MNRRDAIGWLGGVAIVGACCPISASLAASAPAAGSANGTRREPSVGYVSHANASLYYEDVGAGPVVMTTHGGVTENHLYWLMPGVVDALLGAGYRVVSTDMRGHGLSRVTGTDNGFDVETVAADFGAIADHLGINRFHLLTHATGGMAGLRFAMGHSDRLLSLMSTDASSATAPTDEAAETRDPTRIFGRLPPNPQGAAALLRGKTWDEILADQRRQSAQNPYLARLDFAVHPEAAWAQYQSLCRLGDPDALADFNTVFYDDPNPYIARLRSITCPNLVLVGEYDTMFVKPSEQLARELPKVKYVVLAGRGHMTALEDPDRTTDALLGFLATL